MSAQPVRPTSDIRRRLLNGERLTTAGTAEDYGCSRALLGSVVATLRREGMKVTAEPQENGTAEYVVTGAHASEAFGPAAGVRKMVGRGPQRKAAASAPASGVVAKRAPRRNGVAVPTLPELGTDLSVCLLAIGEDGRVSIGFRSSAGTWLTSVDGFSASQTPGG